MARANSAARDSRSARGNRACFLRRPTNKRPRRIPCICTGTQSTRRISSKGAITGCSGGSLNSCSTVCKPTSNSAGNGGSGDSLDHSAGVASPSFSSTIPRKLMTWREFTEASSPDSTQTPTRSTMPVASKLRTASLSRSWRGIPSTAARATPNVDLRSACDFPQTRMDLPRLSRDGSIVAA